MHLSKLNFKSYIIELILGKVFDRNPVWNLVTKVHDDS